MSKNLNPAPIDDKNVMEDWINDVFDNGDYTKDRKRIIGFIDHSPAMASWHDNVLIWTFYEEVWLDRQNSIKELRRRLPQARSLIAVKVSVILQRTIAWTSTLTMQTPSCRLLFSARLSTTKTRGRLDSPFCTNFIHKPNYNKLWQK